MKITSNPNNVFMSDLSKYQLVGFHATSSLACEGIETKGFLPDKIFTNAVHERLIAMAKSRGIYTLDYEEWLLLRSVTFAKDHGDALRHISQGSAGGQGLKNMSMILEKIANIEDTDEATFTYRITRKIDSILAASSVVYAVDLSNLGPRLDPDRIQPLFYFRWNPHESLPLASEIAPSRIIEKLNVQLY